MLRLVLVAALCLPTMALAATATAPAQNRANAAVSGAASLLLSAAAGQSDLCIGVQSAGYGSTAVGVTINLVHRDKDCARIRKAKELQGLGFDAAAVQLMCADPDVHTAMIAAGTPCEAQKEKP